MNQELMKKLQWKGERPVTVIDLPEELEDHLGDPDTGRNYPENLEGR